jgi:hypothetical protein
MILLSTASYGTYLPQGIHGARLLFFVSARTNKRHHHPDTDIPAVAHSTPQITSSRISAQQTTSHCLSGDLGGRGTTSSQMMTRAANELSPPKGARLLFFVSARTNKRHHHLRALVIQSSAPAPGAQLSTPPSLPKEWGSHQGAFEVVVRTLSHVFLFRP